jgi:hypothetical protein
MSPSKPDVTFKVEDHSLHAGVHVVEIWRGDEFLATIYPLTGQRGFKVVSKFQMDTFQNAIGWEVVISDELA